MFFPPHGHLSNLTADSTVFSVKQSGPAPHSFLTLSAVIYTSYSSGDEAVTVCTLLDYSKKTTIQPKGWVVGLSGLEWLATCTLIPKEAFSFPDEAGEIVPNVAVSTLFFLPSIQGGWFHFCLHSTIYILADATSDRWCRFLVQSHWTMIKAVLEHWNGSLWPNNAFSYQFFFYVLAKVDMHRLGVRQNVPITLDSEGEGNAFLVMSWQWWRP